jgi:hypothetical protein
MANAFVTPRYASRSSTADHHAVAITGCARAPAQAIGVDIPSTPRAGSDQGG